MSNDSTKNYYNPNITVYNLSFMLKKKVMLTQWKFWINPLKVDCKRNFSGLANSMCFVIYIFDIKFDIYDEISRMFRMGAY